MLPPRPVSMVTPSLKAVASISTASQFWPAAG
jgi:hypothetical protein